MDIRPIDVNIWQQLEVKQNLDQASESDTVNDSALRDISNLEPVHFKKLLEHSLDKNYFELEVDAKKIVVNVKDKETGDLIRTIPPEHFLKVAQSIERNLSLVDEIV